MAAGSTLRDEMLRRLQAGDAVAAPTMPTAPEPFTIDPKYRKAGFWENFANVASPVLAVASAGAKARDRGASATHDNFWT
jgi:hypothetical protein